MKTDLQHLNLRLHDALDQLVDPTNDDGDAIDDGALRVRIARAGAICQVADRIIECGQLALSAERLRHDTQAGINGADRLLGLGHDGDS